MARVSTSISNKYCPQTLFLYGTYNDDGKPDFGLFCWFSYCWDGELCVMACIGEDKLTRDNIRARKIFSANLVSEKLLHVADYLGNTSGRGNPHKMDIPLNIEKGHKLDIPILSDSPWSFELEVKRTIPLDGGEIYICSIHEVTTLEPLADDSLSIEERLKLAAPIVTAGEYKYFNVDPHVVGSWGQWKGLREG